MTITQLAAESIDDAGAMQTQAFAVQNDEDWVFALRSLPRQGVNGHVVFVPPYGINAHEYFLFSHWLVRNGFDVVRFDGIDNVGLSSGTIEQYTMGQLQRDLARVMDAFFAEPDGLPIVLVSQSLSFPVSLRHTAGDPRVDRLVGLLGVVHVKDTVERVIGSTLDPYFQQQPAPKHQRIFGYLTDCPHFVRDVMAESLTAPADLLPHFERTTVPIHLVSSKADEYVRFEEVAPFQPLVERAGQFVVLPDVSHMLSRSVTVGKGLARMVVEFAIVATGSCVRPDIPKLTETIQLASREADFINRVSRALPWAAA